MFIYILECVHIYVFIAYACHMCVTCIDMHTHTYAFLQSPNLMKPVCA